MQLIYWTLLIFLVAQCPAQAEETAYIGDTLRVGVRKSESDSSASLTVITTGAAVQILERKGGHMKVRTSGGVEGWIKSAYVTHEKPAILLLNDTKKELLALRAQSSSSANVTPPVNAPDSEAPALKEALAELQKQNHQLRTQLQGTQIASSTALNKPQPSPFDAGMPSARAISLYVTGGVTLCFAVGFLVGVSWHRGQVSKRLGGFSL